MLLPSCSASKAYPTGTDTNSDTDIHLKTLPSAECDRVIRTRTPTPAVAALPVGLCVFPKFLDIPILRPARLEKAVSIVEQRRPSSVGRAQGS